MAKITAIPTTHPLPQLVINVPNATATPPARPGCMRYQRWQLLAKLQGSTVSQYYAACKKAGIPCTANNPRAAHAKGFVILTAPTK
tara:strand:- start:264 stop:521 length:258 start_codon:yes stop_codon:yes gene_type:complete